MSLKRTADELEDVFNTPKSSRRSILRAAESPLRFNSSVYSQEPGSEQRRVSFAPDANFRLFDQTQSPNASLRFETNNITEEIHITDSIPNLIDEDEPSMLLNDMMDSPSSSFFRRPSASPFNNRSRRPDLFGSPRSPATRIGGTPPTLLSRVSNDGDLIDYLNTMPRGRINIFDEDDDDDDDDDDGQKQQELQDFKRLEQDMILNGTKNTETQPKEDNRINTQSQTHSDGDLDISQRTEMYSDDESVMITQEQPRPRSPIRRPLRSPIRTPLRSPIQTPLRSPIQTPLRSPIRTPLRSPIRTPLRSPITTPLRSSLGTPSSQPLLSTQTPASGSPWGTPLRNTVVSPLRSTSRNTLQTHQRPSTSSNAYFKSPLRSTTPIPAASPRSFYVHSGKFIEVDPLLNEAEEESDIFQESSQNYGSQNEIIAHKPKMTLSSFLSTASVTFPDDNSAKTGMAYDDLSLDVPEFESREIKYTTTLPEVHVYQKACQQLIASIQRSDEIISNIDQTVSEVNPQLFTEYMDGTAQNQLSIQEQLREIKNYSMLRSKQEWLTIFTDALRDFPTTLEEIRDKLQSYHELEQSIGDKLVEIREYNTKITEIYDQYRQKEQEYQMVDRDQLNRLLNEIQTQKEVYQKLETTSNNLEETVQKLKDEDQALESEIQELNQLLKEIEETIEQNKCITIDDFKNAKIEYNQISKMVGWKVIQMDETTLHLEIDNGVDIITDLQKLNKRHSKAVVCRISTAREDRLGPLIELTNVFSAISKNVWDKYEVNQGIAICWNQIKLIERETELLKRRWWVKIQPLDHKGDLNEAGFSLEIVLFNFEGKSKSIIAFDYRVKDMKNFPAIDLSTLTLKVRYGALDHDTLKNLILEELSKDGILNMEKALQTVLEKTLVTTMEV